MKAPLDAGALALFASHAALGQILADLPAHFPAAWYGIRYDVEAPLW
jgi:hypothetical protein